MGRNLLDRAAGFLLAQRRHKRWQKAVSAMAAVVVFCTTYALILPAITLSNDPICGKEEHVHTEECYATELRYPQSTMDCTLDSGDAPVIHTHDKYCYSEDGTLICELPELEAHRHTGRCYREVRTLICEEEEDLGHEHSDACYAHHRGELICTEEEDAGHTHDDRCYDVDRELTCDDDSEDHEHDDSCYTETRELTCTEEERPGHTHSDRCYEWTEELTCTEEERPAGHVHTDECYEVSTELSCRKEEVIPHTHGEGCYDTEDCPLCEEEDPPEHTHPLICEVEEVLEHQHTAECIVPPEGEPWEVQVLICGKEEHTHTEDCYPRGEADPLPGGGAEVPAEELPAEEVPAEPEYLCGLEEHTHTEECYDEAGELICGLEEHTHDESCLAAEAPAYVCGLEEHIHTEECYDEAGELTCGKEEHTHDETCLKPAEEPLRELSCTGADYTVTVAFGEDAALPEGVTLEVREITAETEEYQTYYDQTVAALQKERAEEPETLVFARFFDICFRLDGAEVEPAAPVSVTITYAEPVDTSEAASCKAIHFAEEGTELLEAETETLADGEVSFTHTQESFSVVGSVVTLTVTNAEDVGPNSLPVDYYVCIDGKWTCVGSTKTGWYCVTDGDLTDYNRDYITVAQAASILENYGFPGTAANPSLVTAYQQKSGHLNIYSDTNSVDVSVTTVTGETGTRKIMPLSRNSDHAGYNLYYLPANTAKISGVASAESLDKAANGFYTVTVSDSMGNVIKKSEPILTGGTFTCDVSGTGVTEWLAAYDEGKTETIESSDGTITLNNITSTVHVSPKRGDSGNNSVTFKVMIDGVWQEVGSLPYYFSNGDQAYITSDMAAQFFGDFGYRASEDPAKHFGYSYNDIYTLFYANGTTKTNFCMDVAGGTIAEAQAVQLYTSNGTDAQVFRIWDAGNGYSFITPIGNSGFHVNAYGYAGGAAGDPSSTQLKLSSAVNENSQWRVDTGSDGRTTFWSAIRPDDQVIDLLNGNMSKTATLQLWHSTGGARYWYLDQQHRISNNTVSTQNADGTYKIELTAESNGDIVCYYMPAETGSYAKAAESEINSNNSFWSVRVRDDGNAVYSDGELESMVQYVLNGGSATVTVRNGDGVIWSVAGASEVEESQSGGYTTFVIKNITQPVEVTATRANPSFTVQYYANIPRFATGGSNPLKVIDTSGKVLPTNGGSMATRSLYLEDTGIQNTQNAGVKTNLFRVATTTELTKMYTDGTFRYEESPGLSYFNKLKDNESYTLKEIWVLKPGKDPASTDRNDWNVYPYGADTAFTNEAGRATGNTILISDGAVLRLVSDSSSGDYHNGTTFYDYDISSGYNAGWRTGITGINSEGNYGISRNGKRTWRSGADVFAFGNANCGTGMSGYYFDGGPLNKWNGTNKNYTGRNTDYGGATFGLANSLNADGTIQYNEWIVVPKLFNESGDDNVTGKQTYTGSSLTFDRVGDTYTLSSATLKKRSGTSSIDGLQYFFHPSPANNVIWDGENNKVSSWQNNIFTNNFWPMDEADDSARKDGNWGTYGNPGSFQGFTETNNYDWGDLAKNFPAGDDGRAHNWFFGMNFALNFTLTEDYVGPLEYTFFGDDDLWVFLDGQLICDIGGVHSSIGEFVNLRDYLPVDGDKTAGRHTLSFFYTERGASGSTCYMSFTLPSVTSATTGRDIGQLQIGKTLGGGATGLDDQEYRFKVELLKKDGGEALKEKYSYKVTERPADGSGNTDGLPVLRYGTVKSGDVITLKNGEAATISGLPAGTYYKVTELTTDGYKTTVNGEAGYIAKGFISNGGTAPASFVNTPYYELPQTGGGGTGLYTMVGALLVGGAVCLLYSDIRRRKEENTSTS